MKWTEAGVTSSMFTNEETVFRTLSASKVKEKTSEGRYELVEA